MPLPYEQGAQLIHTSGTTAKIFGDVEISGLFIMQGNTPDAFPVFQDGNVVIKSGGELRIEP